MAINWKFNADDYKENDFKPLDPGDYRVRIAEAEETTAKSSGNDMIKLTLDVSGHASRLWYYLVLSPDNPQRVNQKLGQIFSSFGITPGDMNVANWVGKVGACRTKHDQYNGETKAVVSYFLSKEKQETLPPWQEAPGKASVTGNTLAGFEGVASDENDLPF